MSSKAYVLRQIKEILQEKKEYSEEETESFIEKHKDDKVYELLLLKKTLKQEPEEELDDVSTFSSIRHS